MFLEIKQVLILEKYEIDAWLLSAVALGTFLLYVVTVIVLVYGFKRRIKCALCKMRLNAKSKGGRDKAIVKC